MPVLPAPPDVRDTEAVVAWVTGLVPDEWLDDEDGVAPQERRDAYRAHLVARLTAPRAFAPEVEDARLRAA